MKVISSSRSLYMCLLILMALVTWSIVKPEVVNAYDFSAFYGAGNCHCADTSFCPTTLGCDSGMWIQYCLTGYPATESCEKDTSNKPCGTFNGEGSPSGGCGVYVGGSYNCEKID